MEFVKGSMPGVEQYNIAVLEGDTHLGAWIKKTGRIDTDQMLPHLRKYVTMESVVYDLGTHIGDHTAFYCSRRPKQVVGFEAFKDAFDCLVHNMKPYETFTELRLFNLCVGDAELVDKAKTAEIHNLGARRLVKGVEGVPTVRLDDMVESGQIKPATFVKVDIEGWEVNAIRGAAKILTKYKPVLCVEVNRGMLERAGTSREELFSVLRSFGYSMTDVFTERPWNNDDNREQFDVICKKE